MLTTPHTHTRKKKKTERKGKKWKRLNALQTLLKLVLRICRLQTLDGGGSEEVEKRWKAVCTLQAHLKGQILSHFIEMTPAYC